MARTAAILNILVRAQTAQAQAAMLRQDAQLKRNAKTAVTASRVVAGATSRMGDQVAAGSKRGAVGLALTAAAAGKLSIDFDKSMRNVNSIAQLPERSFARLEKRVLKLAGPTAQAPRTLADGLYDLVSSGFDADESMQILGKSAKAATAGLTTTEVSTKAVAAVLNAYRLPASRAGKVSDQLFRTVDRGVISFESLAENVGDVLPFASSLHVDLAQVGASIATMTKAGISAPETMTRIKAVMVSMLKPGEDLSKAIKKTGFESAEALIRQKGFQGGLEAIIKTTDGSKSSIAKLFPNVRALGGALALTGENAAGANKDLAGMRASAGATDRALAQQSKSISLQWQRIKAGASAVAIEYGQKLLPKITEVFDVLSDPKLTSAQKLQRITDMITRAFEAAHEAALRWGPRIAGALATGFVTWWSTANPIMKILGAAAIIRLLGGRGAIGATGATIGKYLFGGMALGGATGGAGAAGGGAAAGGMLARLRGGLMRGIGRGALLGVGVALADKVITDFGNRAAARSDDILTALKAKAKDPSEILGVGIEDVFGKSDMTKNAEGLLSTLDRIATKNGRITAGQAAQARDAARFLDLTRKQKREMDRLLGVGVARDNRVRMVMNEFDRMRKGSVLSVRELRQVVSSNFRTIESELGLHSRKGKEAVQTNFRLGLRTIRGFMRDGTITTGQGSKEIARLLRVHSGAGKDSLKRNYKEARDFIAATMRNSKGITGEGMKAIRRIFARELRLYGLSDEAIKFRLAGKEQSGKTIGAPLVNKQRGGPITYGKMTGDSVPALLERGEYVLNRKAVAKAGVANLDRLNFTAAARFQTGGLAGMIGAANRVDRAQFPYLWGGGHQGSPAPFGPFDCSGAVSYVLQHGGVPIPTMVSGALMNAGLPGPGAVTVFANPTHTFMRIRGRYFGTSGQNPGGGAGWFSDPGSGYRSRFVQRHFKVSGAGAGGMGVRRVKVAGPDGPLKSIAQTTLDRTRRAANARLDALTSMTVGAGDVGDAGPFGRFLSTAYGPPWGGIQGTGVTATGIDLRNNPARHLVAVDPSVIPLHSKLRIQPNPFGYKGAFGAEDTGGAIQGRRIDFYDWLGRDHQHAWGERMVSVERLRKGGLAGMLNRAVNIVGGLNKHGKRFPAKRRSKALHRLLDRIKDIGLPAHIEKNLKRYGDDAGIFAEYASRAGQLTTEDANGNTVPGLVDGLNEAQWLEKQLEMEFKLRNALIRAEEIVVRKRDAITALITKARDRLKKIAAAIREAGKVHDRLERAKEKADDLSGASAPAKARAIVAGLKGRIPDGLWEPLKRAVGRANPAGELRKALREQIKDINRDQGVRVRERGVLNDRILPALTGRRSKLNTARGDLLDTLNDVQGIGSPMERLTSLPEIGVLGGRILEAQLRLRELNAPKPAVTDSETGGAGTALLEQLLREANLRTAVSQAQYKVLSDFRLPYMGAFAAGGVALVGEYGPELAHMPSGTRVHSARDTESLLSQDVSVIVNGSIVQEPGDRRDPVEVVIGDRRFEDAVVRVQRSTARRGGNPRPGRGGGLG